MQQHTCRATTWLRFARCAQHARTGMLVAIASWGPVRAIASTAGRHGLPVRNRVDAAAAAAALQVIESLHCGREQAMAATSHRPGTPRCAPPACRPHAGGTEGSLCAQYRQHRSETEPEQIAVLHARAREYAALVREVKLARVRDIRPALPALHSLRDCSNWQFSTLANRASHSASVSSGLRAKSAFRCRPLARTHHRAPTRQSQANECTQSICTPQCILATRHAHATKNWHRR